MSSFPKCLTNEERRICYIHGRLERTRDDLKGSYEMWFAELRQYKAAFVLSWVKLFLLQLWRGLVALRGSRKQYVYALFPSIHDWI